MTDLRSLLAFVLLAACGSARPGPAPARPVSGPPSVRSAPREPPRPTAPTPRGTPTAEGRIDALVPIDDQHAIVRFLVPGLDHWRLWWIASMRRDGALDWLQPLSGDLQPSDESSIEIVGDSVSLVSSSRDGEPILTLHAFALADGAPRFHTSLGTGVAQHVVIDGARRFDVRATTELSSGEVIASTGQGVLWKRRIGSSPIPGYEPALVGDALVLRTRIDSADDDHALWVALDRVTGRSIGTLSARVQSCSDGRRWLVRTDDALVEVDPTNLSTRPVARDLTIPGVLPGTWAIEDCAFAEGAPVVLVSRGLQSALVALDGVSFAVRGAVEIGTSAVGPTGFDPLPARLHRVAALSTLARDGAAEIFVADPFASRLVGRWISREEHVHPGLELVEGGYLVTTPRTLAWIDARTGVLEGRAVWSEDRVVAPSSRSGSTLWLSPGEPLQLGASAPRLVELARSPDAAVRDAVHADLVAAGAAGRSRCPDPRAVIRGDGLGPALRTRLPTWDLEVLAETARIYACAPGSAVVRLLAWYVMQDSRPLRNDNALLAVEERGPAAVRFTLVQVYRHANNRAWNVDSSFHDPSEPVRTFDHRPTSDEVDAFLAQSHWTFADDWGRVIAGNVLDAEWVAAIGERPRRGFPAGIEQRD